MSLIDVKDRKILAELDMNARVPLTELARKVGLSRQVVEYRIERLKKEGIIFGSFPVFDSAAAGYFWYRVVFRLFNIKKEEKHQLIEGLKKNKYVLWIGEVGGNWDIIVNFVCNDNFEFNTLFENIISIFGSYIRDYEILIYLNVYDLQRSYLLPIKSTRREFFHEMKYNPQLILDDIDKKIIKELNTDAEHSNLELGQKIGVSGNTIRNRIDLMIKNRLILGFRTFINPSALGYTSHLIFLEITRLDLEREKKLYAYMRSIPQVTFVVRHIGRWRIALEIETKDDYEFQDVFVDIRGKFSDIITDFESFPLLKDHAINYFPEGNLHLT